MKVIDWVTADHKKLLDLVDWSNERYDRLIAKVIESVDRVFDRLEAKLDEYATLGMRRPDDDSQPRPTRH